MAGIMLESLGFTSKLTDSANNDCLVHDDAEGLETLCKMDSVGEMEDITDLSFLSKMALAREFCYERERPHQVIDEGSRESDGPATFHPRTPEELARPSTPEETDKFGKKYGGHGGAILEGGAKGERAKQLKYCCNSHMFKDIADFGTGVSLYFQTVQYFTVLALICAICCIPVMLSHSVQQRYVPACSVCGWEGGGTGVVRRRVCGEGGGGGGVGERQAREIALRPPRLALLERERVGGGGVGGAHPRFEGGGDPSLERGLCSVPGD